MKPIDKRRAILAVTTILIILPMGVLQDASAQGFAAGHSGSTDHTIDNSSGVIVPLYSTAPRSIPAEAVDRGEAHPQTRGLGTTLAHNPSTVGQGLSATQSSSSIILLSGFNGLDQTQSCACVPPDVQIAAGPNQVVEMVNLEGEVFTKQGVSNRTFSLSTFFRTGVDTISDPKVLFDAPSGRWFSSVLDISLNSISLGVSSTSDANGGWVLYSISAGSFVPDQPILGISDDKLAVAANDFSGNTFVGSQFWILNKSQLVAGVTTNFFTSGANSGVFSVHPVHSLSSTTTQFMISEVVSHRIISTTSLRLFSVTGVPGVSTVSVATNDLSVSTIGTLSGSAPPGGVQPGTSATVNTNDIRIQVAVWYKNATWLGLDDACTPTGDTQIRSCIRLVKIATVGSPTISQDFDFGANQEYVYYPAVSMDKNGNLVTVYGYSNGTIFPSIAITGQLATDPTRSLAPPHTLKTGDAADTSTRYGDYFGAALDPSDPSVVWVNGEYHNSSTGSCQSFGSCWSTFIGSTSMTGFNMSASPIRLSAASGASSTLSFTSINRFAGLVSITTTKPKGIMASSPQPVNVTSGRVSSTQLSFSVASTLPPGNYTVNMTGSNGTLSRATSLTLTVFPDFEIALACSCNTVTAVTGSQFQESLTLSGVNGFSGTVGLKALISPIASGGPTLSLGQANQTLPAGGTAVTTFLVNAGNNTGMFSITLIGACLSGSCTSPSQQDSIFVTLIVTPPISFFGGGGGGGGRALRM